MSASTNPKPTLWLTVRSIKPGSSLSQDPGCDAVPPCPFVLQVASRYRSNFTRTITPNTEGLIDATVTLAIRPSEKPSLIIHPVTDHPRRPAPLVQHVSQSPPSSPLSPVSSASSKLTITPTESAPPFSLSSCATSTPRPHPVTLRPPVPLSLDFNTLLQSLQALQPQSSTSDRSACMLTASARGADATVVTFHATLHDPTLAQDTPSDDSSVHPYMDDFVPLSMQEKRSVDASFSSVSDDGGDFPLSPTLLTPDKHPIHKSHRNHVKFDSQLYQIPTMENLHRQVLAAQSDRSQLWLGVGDLTEQIGRLRSQLHTLQATLDTQQHQKVAPASPTSSNQSTMTKSSRCSTKSHSNKLNRRRRRVVLDGDALAQSFAEAHTDVTHPKFQFDSRGITTAIDYYAARGRRAVAVVNEHTWTFLRSQADDGKQFVRQLSRLEDLKRRRMLYTCPASCLRKRDFLLQFALDHDAEVVANNWASNDDQSGRELSQDIVTTFMFIDGKFVPQRSDGLDQFTTLESGNRSGVRRSATW